VEILGKEYDKNEAINTMAKENLVHVANRQFTKHSG
jgi:hypothetical protein